MAFTRKKSIASDNKGSNTQIAAASYPSGFQLFDFYE